MKKDRFTTSVQNFQQKQTSKNLEELTETFYRLAEHIVKSIVVDEEFIFDMFFSKDRLIANLVLKCFERLESYDPQVGPAFNYFTTLSCNYMTAEFKKCKKMRALKAKYGEFLKPKVC